MNTSRIKTVLLWVNSNRLSLYLLILFTTAGLLFIPNVFSNQYNGFDIGLTPLIPASEIQHGGPPRDGIPSIDKPIFIPAITADYLHTTDRIIGLVANNTAKAYPVRILNWHEIVNDGDLVISYCPLCGTGMAYESPDANFGVSGLLYNSDMLLFDRETESLWSQIMAKAISGKRKGESLSILVVENTSWEDWLNKHPDTLVLSEETGFSRNYSVSPYGNYSVSKALYFPVNKQSRRFHPKEKVIGIEINGLSKVYAFSELSKSKSSFIQDRIGKLNIEVHFNPLHRTAHIRTSKEQVMLPSLTSYWFAWFAFHPASEIYIFKKQ